MSDDTDIAINRVSHLLTSWSHDEAEYERKLQDYGLDVLEPAMVPGAVNHRGELAVAHPPHLLPVSAASPAGLQWVRQSEFVDVERELDDSNRLRRREMIANMVRQQQQQQQPSQKLGSEHNELQRLSPMRRGALIGMRKAEPAPTGTEQHQQRSNPRQFRHRHDHHQPNSVDDKLHHIVYDAPLTEQQQLQLEQRRNNMTRRAVTPTVTGSKAATHSSQTQQQQHQQQQRQQHWWNDYVDKDEKRIPKNDLDDDDAARTEESEAEFLLHQKRQSSSVKLIPRPQEEIVDDGSRASSRSSSKGNGTTAAAATAMSSTSQGVNIEKARRAATPPTSSRAALRLVDEKIVGTGRGVVLQPNEVGRLVPPSFSSAASASSRHQRQQPPPKSNDDKLPLWLKDQYRRMWQRRRVEERHRLNKGDAVGGAEGETSGPPPASRQHNQQQQQQQQQDRSAVLNVSAATAVSPPPPSFVSGSSHYDYYGQRFQHHRQQLTEIDDKSQRAFEERNNKMLHLTSASLSAPNSVGSNIVSPIPHRVAGDSVGNTSASYHFALADKMMAEARLEAARFGARNPRLALHHQSSQELHFTHSNSNSTHNNNSNNSNSSGGPPPGAASSSTSPSRRRTYGYLTASGRRYGETPLTQQEQQRESEALDRTAQAQQEREQQLSARRLEQSTLQRKTLRLEAANGLAKTTSGGEPQHRKTVDTFWDNDVSSPEGLREHRAQLQAAREEYAAAATAPQRQRKTGASLHHHDDSGMSRMFSQESRFGDGSAAAGGLGVTSVVITQTIENTGPPQVVHFVSPLGRNLKAPSSAISVVGPMEGDAAVRSFLGDLGGSNLHDLSAITAAAAGRTVVNNNSSSNNNNNNNNNNNAATLNNSSLTHAMLSDLHGERWDAVPGAQYRPQESTAGLSGVTRHSQLQWRDSLRSNTRSQVRTPFSSTVTPMLAVNTTMYTMPTPAPIDEHGRVVGAPSNVQRDINDSGAASSGSALGLPTAMINTATAMPPLCPLDASASFSQRYQQKQEERQRLRSIASDGGGGGSVLSGSAGKGEWGGEAAGNSFNNSASGIFDATNNNNNNGRSVSAEDGNNNNNNSKTEEWLLRRKQLWRERASKKREEEMKLQEELRTNRELAGVPRPNAMRDITNSNRNTAMTSLTGKESFASPLLGGKSHGLPRRRSAAPGDKYRVAVAQLEKVCEENDRHAALLLETEAATKKGLLPASPDKKSKNSAVSVISGPTITVVDRSEKGAGGGMKPSVSFSAGEMNNNNNNDRSASAMSGFTSVSQHSSDAGGATTVGSVSAYNIRGAGSSTGANSNNNNNNNNNNNKAAALGDRRAMSPKDKRRAERLELAYDRAEKYSLGKPVAAADVAKPADQRHHHAVMSPTKVAMFLPPNFTLLSASADYSGGATTAAAASASGHKSINNSNSNNNNNIAIGGALLRQQQQPPPATDIVAAKALSRAVKAAAAEEERRRNHKDTTPAWMLSAEQEDDRAEQERLDRSEWGGMANAAALDAAASAAAKRKQPWASFADRSREPPKKKLFGQMGAAAAAAATTAMSTSRHYL